MYNKYQIYLINNQPKFNVLFRVFFANPKSEEKVPPVACDCWAAGFWPICGVWLAGFVGEFGPKSFILILSNILGASRHTIYPSCII